MHGRTFAFALVLALIVPVAAQAEPTHVEAPIAASGAELTAEGAALVLEDGNASLVASARSGSLIVWEQRTPCYQQDRDSCLEDRSRSSRTQGSLSSATITVTPREDRVHRSLIQAEEGRFAMSAEATELTIRPERETVELDDDAPEDVATAELPRGLEAVGDEADLTLEGDIVLQTTNAVVRVETNGSQARELVTGVSWDRGEDGFYYRTLRLVKASFAGGATSAWDDAVRATPRLPTGLAADRAEVNVTSGQLAGASAEDGRQTIADLEATVTAIAWNQQQPPRLVVEQGSQPAPAVEDTPSEEGVSGTTLVGAGSAAAAAVLLTAYYWPRIAWAGTALVLPLYSRIEKDELFENDTREALYERIKDDPGVHAHALSEAVDIGWGTTVYHLRRLERNGFVHSEKRGRYRRFFPASGFVEKQREALSVLQNETTEDIATLVREQPGLNQSAICEQLDISPSLANWHLNRLIDAELVDRERRGRTVHYTPGEAWKALERAADVETAEVPGDAQAA